MAPIPARYRAPLTVTLSLAVFMNVLDLSIANVAIPTIAGDLGVSTDNGTWVITLFAVSTAIAMPLTGWLGRRFGEVRSFVVCTAAFTAISWMCGLTTNMSELVTMRAIQGFAAGPMIPLSQSLLLANYPDDRKNLALALLLMVTVAAPVLGPILGGWITDNWAWEWIFYINVPIGIIATLGTGWLLRGRETPTVRVPVDKIGIGLLAVGVGSLQIMLDRGKDLDWFGSPTIVALTVTSLVGLVFFVVWELTEKQPAVDLRLLAGRNFTVGTAVLCIGYGVYFGNIVLLPLWLQTQMGYTATWAGLAAAPVGILPIMLAPIVGRFMSRIDLRWWCTASFIAFGSVYYWYACFDTQVPYGHIARSCLAQGLGLAFFFPPLLAIVISGLPEGRVASATGLANTLRTLAGSFSVSLTTTWWDRREALHQSHLTERFTAFDHTAHNAVAHLHALHAPGHAAFAVIERALIQQAYMLATDDLYWLWGGIFLSLIAVIWLARPPFAAGRAMVAGD